MNRWIVFLLASAMTLSGCASDEPADPAETTGTETSTSSTETTTTSTSGTGTTSPDPGQEPEPTPNTAPVASLTVIELGAAGSQSSFSVNVTDADGDSISWVLDANGDGVVDLDGVANATAVFTFDEAGTFVANLTATDGSDNATVTLEIVIEAPAEEAPTVEDRGWYLYDTVTSLCHVKSFTAYGGAIYTSALGGGTWVLAEANGEDGLQIADDHPTSGTGAGFEVAGAEDCVDGDLILV